MRVEPICGWRRVRTTFSTFIMLSTQVEKCLEKLLYFRGCRKVVQSPVNGSLRVQSFKAAFPDNMKQHTSRQ